jgi:phospholipase/carboxylesterase
MERDATMTLTSHVHQFVPGSTQGAVPIVMLHGSGGDERDLLPLAEAIAPGAPTLGIRGTAQVDGGFAFFDRRPDRSLDEADIEARIPALAAFIEAAAETHGFARPAVVVGYSNGAIMAAALLLTRPTLFSGAILLRPQLPFLAERPAHVPATPVLIIDGEKDSRRSPGDGAQLAERLSRAGATITHHVLPSGHAITERDHEIARDWLIEWRNG